MTRALDKTKPRRATAYALWCLRSGTYIPVTGTLNGTEPPRLYATYGEARRSKLRKERIVKVRIVPDLK